MAQVSRKILIVGKGGREHALIDTLARSPSQPTLFSYPGSDAIAELATVVKLDGSLQSLLDFMQREGVTLCVAGEESYLVREQGLANRCEEAGIRCWGPRKEAAQLEADKVFAKQFLERHRIPTAGYAVAATLEEGLAALDTFPTVLKFDGLAAGKGVVISQDQDEAKAFLKLVFEDRIFGEGNVVVEEFLTGPEISIFVSIAGPDYQILAAARDYKRIFDGDLGPNTGGMGAVASPAMLEPAMREQVEREIIRPTVDGLVKDGLSYRGFLYFGIMLTPAGPKVLEYNCRFGDPEAEAVMPLIEGDFAEYLWHCAGGQLNASPISLTDAWSVCVILASAGYPAGSRNGDVIHGLETLADVTLYHCGTRRNAQGSFETQGGRVLAVVAQARTREEAVTSVYSQVAKIHFDGRQNRQDIGTRNF